MAVRRIRAASHLRCTRCTLALFYMCFLISGSLISLVFSPHILVVSPLRRLRIRVALNSSSRAVGVFAYSSWILSEVLVVVVTLSATYHYTALAGTTGHGQRSLSAVLFRDGMCTQSFAIYTNSHRTIRYRRKCEFPREQVSVFSCTSLASHVVLVYLPADTESRLPPRRKALLLSIAQLIVHLFAVRFSLFLLRVACTASEKGNSAPAPGSMEHLCSHHTHSRGAVRPDYPIFLSCATLLVHLLYTPCTAA